MSFMRITEPGTAAVDLDDLGITLGLSSITIISNQFSIQDLYVSADLEAAIIAGDLTVELDFGTGFTVVSAGDYTNRDALGTFLNIYEITNENNNEDLVDGSEVNASGPAGAPLHIHDARYYTETELSSTTASSGGTLIGIDDTNFTNISGTTAQEVFDSIDNAIASVDLDDVYTNDADGIMNVNGTSKDLDLKSDNSNDIIISRVDGGDAQEFLIADVSGNELILGDLIQGILAQIDVRIRSNLIVDGDITFTGSITDTTVDELNVTNANILLRDGATVGGDAAIEVERGSTGPDACLTWNETTDRWEFGIIGTKASMVGDENDEDISGVWCFGGDATEPDLCLLEKASAPTTNLGAAGEIPMAMMPNGILAIYDKSNSRNKFLSVARQYMTFTGRNNPNNSNEYARIGEFPSNNGGAGLFRDATLLGITLQTKGVETWTAEVRKNGVATVLASLASGGADGNEVITLNVDFDAGDEIQMFINGTSVGWPLMRLEFADRF